MSYFEFYGCLVSIEVSLFIDYHIDHIEDAK